MNQSNDRSGDLSRRGLLKGAAAGIALSAGAPNAIAAPTGDNRIQLENAKPGTRDWLLTNTYIDPDTWWRSPRIEGYCSEASVSAGDTLKVMVSTNPVAEFDLEIFRTGYYGGAGARSMKKFESIQGTTQSDPPIADAPF